MQQLGFGIRMVWRNSLVSTLRSTVANDRFPSEMKWLVSYALEMSVLSVATSAGGRLVVVLRAATIDCSAASD